MTYARATNGRIAGILVLLCCNAANADLGLTFWSHETVAFRENQHDRQSLTPSLTPGPYLQDSLSQIDDTLVSASFAALVAVDRVGLTITSNHVVWPPSHPDDGADANALALLVLQPDIDVLVTVSATGTYQIPHDDTSFSFVFEVLNYNFDLIHRGHAGTGVPGSGSLSLDDELTLIAGATYYVTIDTGITSYDAVLPPAPASAEGVFTVILNTVPEPAMLTGLLIVAVASLRREPCRPHPR